MVGDHDGGDRGRGGYRWLAGVLADEIRLSRRITGVHDGRPWLDDLREEVLCAKANQGKGKAWRWAQGTIGGCAWRCYRGLGLRLGGDAVGCHGSGGPWKVAIVLCATRRINIRHRWGMPWRRSSGQRGFGGGGVQGIAGAEVHGGKTLRQHGGAVSSYWLGKRRLGFRFRD